MSPLLFEIEQTEEAIDRPWPVFRLSDLTDVVRGASPRPKGDPKYFGGDIPWIMIADVTRQPGKYLYTTRQFVTSAGAEKSRLLKPGSLVLTNSGTVCVPKILAVAGCIHDGFLAFPQLHKSVELDFAYYWFEFIRPQIIRENQQGVTQVNLNTQIVKDIVIPVPSISEQKAVVEKIEKQFSRLDVGIAALKRAQANLKRYRASVLKAACEGRLVQTEAELACKDRRLFEPADKLLLQIESWSMPNKASVNGVAKQEFHTLYSLPNGWCWANPNLLTCEKKDIGAGPFGTIFKAKDFRDSGVPIIFLRHVSEGKYLTKKPGFMDVNKWTELFQEYSVFGGELLITKLGDPPGLCAIYPDQLGPAMVTPDVIKMKPSPLVNSKFLMYYINSETGRKFATGAAFGTTRLRLTLPIFREMPIPLPPLAEQVRIVAEIERLLSVADAVEANLDQQLARATRLRQSILAKAFSGGA